MHLLSAELRIQVSTIAGASSVKLESWIQLNNTWNLKSWSSTFNFKSQVSSFNLYAVVTLTETPCVSFRGILFERGTLSVFSWHHHWERSPACFFPWHLHWERRSLCAFPWHPQSERRPECVSVAPSSSERLCVFPWNVKLEKFLLEVYIFYYLWVYVVMYK